jgi:hypothetical protein
MKLHALFLGNRAYFFGGVHDDEEDDETLFGSFFNDLYCLDLEKLNFSRSKCQLYFVIFLVACNNCYYFFLVVLLSYFRRG